MGIMVAFGAIIGGTGGVGGLAMLAAVALFGLMAGVV